MFRFVICALILLFVNTISSKTNFLFITSFNISISTFRFGCQLLITNRLICESEHGRNISMKQYYSIENLNSNRYSSLYSNML